MVPPVRNTQVRGPLAATQARSDPGPESFRLAIKYTLPPRPPFESAPPPCAPGNAATAAIENRVKTMRGPQRRRTMSHVCQIACTAGRICVSTRLMRPRL